MRQPLLAQERFMSITNALRSTFVFSLKVVYHTIIQIKVEVLWTYSKVSGYKFNSRRIPNVLKTQNSTIYQSVDCGLG